MTEFISIRGARENNLKDVTLEIPKRRLTIFTGVSGSGKSLIVFELVGHGGPGQFYESFSLLIPGLRAQELAPDSTLGCRRGA